MHTFRHITDVRRDYGLEAHASDKDKPQLFDIRLPGALFADYHVDLDLVAPPPRCRVARAGVPKGTILG